MKHIDFGRMNREDRAKGQIELNKMIDKKQALEFDTAKKLRDEFSDRSTLLHNGLKGLVMVAMDDIQRIWQLKGERAIKRAYYKDAVNYNFIKLDPHRKTYFGSHTAFYHHITNIRRIEELDAAGLGNLIRFFGEVIEAGSAIGKKEEYGSYIKYPKWDYKHGKDAESPIDKNVYEEDWTGGQKSFFEKQLSLMKSKQKFSEDMYWAKKDKQGKQGLIKGLRKRKEARNYSELELKQKRAKNNQTQNALIAVGGGISLYQQLEEDLLNRMDLVFGLSHGATISGTTTDTIYFINRMALVDKYWSVGVSPQIKHSEPDWEDAYYQGWDWGLYQKTKIKYIVQHDRTGKVISKRPYLPERNASLYSTYGYRGLDPVYYMLPFGTIVGGAHHTTLEVALPLAINLNYDLRGKEFPEGRKVFKYNIGMYKTLMPIRGRYRENEPGSNADGIRKILSNAENHGDNVFVLIYYKGKEPGGYLIFDKNDGEDMMIWKEVARADAKLMKNFKGFNYYPTKQNIMTLLGVHRNILGLGSSISERIGRLRDAGLNTG